MSNIFESTVIRVDNLPDILKYCFNDGTSIWPSLRFQLRFYYLEKMATSQNPLNLNNIPQESKTSLTKYLWHTFIKGAWRNASHIDILSIANYEGNPECPNRMTVFLKSLNNFKKRELLYSPKWRIFPKLKDTFSFDYFYNKALIMRKIGRPKPSNNSISDIIELLKIVSVEFEGIITPQNLSALKPTLLRNNEITLLYHTYIEKYLKKCTPKLILCSEGNNGDWRHAILFTIANKLNIPSAEVQHGIFNIGMKYGKKLVTQKQFIQQKSKYLFSFGKFHCSQTNLPAKCIPLGHYHLELAKKELLEFHKKASNSLNILFICEGIPTSSINNGLVNATYSALRQLKTPFQLTIRLHPSESANPKYDKLFEFSNSRYSDFKSENIHRLIVDSDIVICHASTVVFEALYFEKNPLVLEDAATSEYIPKGVGLGFKDAGELLQHIESGAYKMSEYSNELGYWASGNVADNFNEFWKKEIEKNG